MLKSFLPDHLLRCPKILGGSAPQRSAVHEASPLSRYVCPLPQSPVSLLHFGTVRKNAGRSVYWRYSPEIFTSYPHLPPLLDVPFQSMPRRRGRPGILGILRGVNPFQSTLPRRGRPVLCAWDGMQDRFQSTPPRGFITRNAIYPPRRCIPLHHPCVRLPPFQPCSANPPGPPLIVSPRCAPNCQSRMSTPALSIAAPAPSIPRHTCRSSPARSRFRADSSVCAPVISFR